MTLAFPPNFIGEMDKYTRGYEKRTMLPMSRTDLIVAAVHYYIQQKREGVCNDIT